MPNENQKKKKANIRLLQQDHIPMGWRDLQYLQPPPPQQLMVYNLGLEVQEAAPAPPAGGAGDVVVRQKAAVAPRGEAEVAAQAPPPREEGPGLDQANWGNIIWGVRQEEAFIREGRNPEGAPQIVDENQFDLYWGGPPANPDPPAVQARQPEINMPAVGGRNYALIYQQHVVADANAPGQRYQAAPEVAFHYNEVAPPAAVAQEASNGVEEMPKLEGNPVDLDHLIGTTANRIESIGIEVEGAWGKPPKMGYHAIHADASVFKNVILPVAYDAKGEIASPPLIPAAKGKWLAENYPIYTDHTCGLHIHMKFKKAHYYSLLMDSPDYQATLLAYLTKWAKEEGFPPDHCIWSRLAGKNKYCKPNYWPDLQVLQKVKPRNVEAVAGTTGHRYTICNFCWGLGNQTMEVRVLPMMKDAVTASRALDVIIKVTNAYIRAMLPKNQKDREQYRKSLTASCKIVFEEDDIKGTGKVQVYI